MQDLPEITDTNIQLTDRFPSKDIGCFPGGIRLKANKKFNNLKQIIMERKHFLKNSLGLLGAATIIDACKKSDSTGGAGSGSGGSGSGSGSGSCVVAPTEVEGPYPYPGGEINNPLNRSDVRVISGTTLKTGVPLGLTFTVVNTNSNCAVVSGVRVDIWHCDARGYYSGYAGQTGVDGTLSFVGQTWLRGYQTTAADGKAAFTTVYPGWYGGRATHIHFEVFIGGVLKKTGQVTFLESISDAVHVSAGYNGTVNTTRNTADSIFGNSAADLANEYVALSGSIAAGYTGTYTIGLAL